MQVSAIPLLHFQPVFLQTESTTKSKPLHTHTKPNTQTQLTINDSWYNIDVLKMVFYEPEGTVIYLFLNV